MWSVVGVPWNFERLFTNNSRAEEEEANNNTHRHPPPLHVSRLRCLITLLKAHHHPAPPPLFLLSCWPPFLGLEWKHTLGNRSTNKFTRGVSSLALLLLHHLECHLNNPHFCLAATAPQSSSCAFWGDRTPPKHPTRPSLIINLAAHPPPLA